MSTEENDHLDTIALLQAMYPLEDEFVLSPETSHWVENPSSPIPNALGMTLRVSLDQDPAKHLELYVSLQGGLTKISPRQPPWLNKTAFQTLHDSIGAQDDTVGSSEYILESVETIKYTASTLISDVCVDKPEQVEEEEGVLERVWFWFPMLSTREKRKDLVQYAPRYNLTGFVLAGKPALLCLEGEGKKVERYMSDIKSISWSDVPSFQKKVSERFRRPLVNGQRAFKEMRDITNDITHYGQYNHRGDMGDVRRLMEKWGVGDDFGAAVLNSD